MCVPHQNNCRESLGIARVSKATSDGHGSREVGHRGERSRKNIIHTKPKRPLKDGTSYLDVRQSVGPADSQVNYLKAFELQITRTKTFRRTKISPNVVSENETARRRNVMFYNHARYTKNELNYHHYNFLLVKYTSLNDV
jgi:hypothetical protein